MKTLFTVLISCLFFASFTKLPDPKNHLTEMNLLGKVRSIAVFEYEMFIDSTGTTVKGKRKFRNIESDHRLFNATGNKILEVWYNKDNTFEIKDSILYDSLNRLTESFRLKSNGTKYKTVCSYDAKNRKTQMIKYRSNGSVFSKLVYFYDPKNNLTEQNEFDEKGLQSEHIVFKYDAFHNVIEEISSIAGSPLTKNTFKYDTKGNNTERRWYEPDGKPGEEMMFKYDDKNNIIEIDSYDAHGILLQKYKYKYTFDLTGNWINCTVYKNDNVTTLKERKIEYFP